MRKVSGPTDKVIVVGAGLGGHRDRRVPADVSTAPDQCAAEAPGARQRRVVEQG